MVARERQLLDHLVTVHDVYLLTADADRHTDPAHSNNTPNQYFPPHPAYR